MTTGDITGLAVDAIVNAANAALMGGGGVDGAHSRARRSHVIRGLQRTQAHALPGRTAGRRSGADDGRQTARAVRGPYRGSDLGADEPAAKLLASCYRRAIELVDAEGLQSIAFPAISTGAYGYPKDRAAAVASKAIAEALAKAHSVRKVHLVFFSDADRDMFVQHQQFP